MGICRTTLWAWRGKHPELEKVIRAGKEVADYQMENALYKSGIEGNVTAQIFWLKYRRPDKWNKPAPVAETGTSVEVQKQKLEELRQLLMMSVPPCEGSDV